MLASSVVIVCVVSVRTLAISSMRADHEVVGIAGLELVARRAAASVMRRPTPEPSRRSTRRHGDVVDVLMPCSFFMHGRVRREDRVVLVLARSPTGPCCAITPITLNGWLLDADDLPGRIGVGPNSVSRHDRAEHGDLRGASSTSCGVKKLPYFVGQLRISGRSTSVPWICVVQFWLPAIDLAARVRRRRRRTARRAASRIAVGVVGRQRAGRCPGPAARRPA